MNPKCHICSAPAVFLMKKDGFDEYICPTCKLSFVHPQPKAEWLKDKLYSYESGYQSNKRPDLASITTNVRTLKALDYLVSRKPKGQLLDVGCSSGELMYAAEKRGMSAKGVEINKRTADMAVANGFEVHQGFLETCPFDKKSFDVVYLGDVIEHVNNPRDFVRTALGFLKEGGLLAISTPNMDCWWSRTTLLFYRAFGIPWACATPPHHLFQFSHNNLSLLIKEFGFCPTTSIFTGPASLKYELGSLHLFGAWKRDKSGGKFLFMLFSFALYAVVFGLTKVLRPFLRKKFEMVAIYEKC